jgi:hypothetical protein
LKTPAVASTAAAGPPQGKLVAASAIRTFLDVQGLPTPATAANAKDALVRVICARR